jgi:hypothetical protein
LGLLSPFDIGYAPTRRGEVSLLINTAWLLEDSERFTTEVPGRKPSAVSGLYCSIKNPKIQSGWRGGYVVQELRNHKGISPTRIAPTWIKRGVGRFRREDEECLWSQLQYHRQDHRRWCKEHRRLNYDSLALFSVAFKGRRLTNR